jgi:hypothetical protein
MPSDFKTAFLLAWMAENHDACIPRSKVDEGAGRLIFAPFAEFY